MVYRGNYNDGGKNIQVAIKRMDYDNNTDRSESEGEWERCVKNEIDIHSKLSHPNIVKFIGHEFVDDHVLNIYLELCEYGDTSQYVRDHKVETSLITNWFLQLLDGLEYLRSELVVHCDIKPSNILKHGKSIKIADFGMAIKLKREDEMIERKWGTPNFLSPELIRKRYSFSTDLWAAMVSLYYWMERKYPFHEDRKIKKGEFLEPKNASLREICRIYFVPNVEERPDISMVRELIYDVLE